MFPSNPCRVNTQAWATITVISTSKRRDPNKSISHILLLLKKRQTIDLILGLRPFVILRISNIIVGVELVLHQVRRAFQRKR